MGFQSAPGCASFSRGLFRTTSAWKRRLCVEVYRWTRVVVWAAVGALIFLPGAVSGEDIHVVDVEATGASLEGARRNAVRAALQETMDQLVLAERAVEDGRLVKDRLLSTVNGFVREFEILETVEGELEYRVRARVGVSNADIENYVDYLDPSGPSGVDGESVFQEIDRRKLEAASLRRILRHLVRGVPLYRFSVAVDEVAPSDSALRSPYHALPKAEDSVDVRFTSRLQEDVGRSLHVFLESLESAQNWTCRSPGNPVVLNWHHGSMASAWHECGERNGSFFDHFSACSSGDAGQPLSCTTVRPGLSDGEPLYRPPHTFATPRNFGIFIYAFLDEAGRSTHEGAACGVLSGRPDYAPPGVSAAHMGRVYPLKGDEIHLWQTTSARFAAARFHMFADHQERRFFARIPVADTDLGATRTLKIGQVYLKPDGSVVTSLEEPGKRFREACAEFLGSSDQQG